MMITRTTVARTRAPLAATSAQVALTRFAAPQQISDNFPATGTDELADGGKGHGIHARKYDEHRPTEARIRGGHPILPCVAVMVVLGAAATSCREAGSSRTAPDQLEGSAAASARRSAVRVRLVRSLPRQQRPSRGQRLGATWDAHSAALANAHRDVGDDDGAEQQIGVVPSVAVFLSWCRSSMARSSSSRSSATLFRTKPSSRSQHQEVRAMGTRRRPPQLSAGYRTTRLPGTRLGVTCRQQRRPSLRDWPACCHGFERRSVGKSAVNE